MLPFWKLQSGNSMAIKVLALIFFLLEFAHITKGQECRQLKFYKRDDNMALVNHKIKTVEVDDVASCQVQCYIELLCVSVNVGPAVNGKRACELSSSDHVIHPSDLRGKVGYQYHSVKNNHCISSPCPHGITCKPVLTDTGGYVCLPCKPGQDCDIDGAWSNWSSWSPCVKASANRTRTCTNPAPQRNGIDCTGSVLENRTCVSYTQLGCFSDAQGDPRPFPVMIISLRPDIDWNNMTKTIHACALATKNHGFSLFGIEFYGECWSGNTTQIRYDKDGPSNTCWAGVGQDNTLMAYKLD